MRRIVSPLLRYVLLGIVVNIAVAWGCAMFINHHDHSALFERTGCSHDRSDCAHWFVASRTFPLGERVWSFWSKVPGNWGVAFSRRPEDVLPTWANFVQPSGSRAASCRIEAIARGWPMLCLCTVDEVTVDGPATAGMPRVERRSAAKVPAGTYRARAGINAPGKRELPIRPLPLGFMVNSLSYAAALWIVLASPGAWRFVRRSRRGLCIKCGYDLRGSQQQCPECGWTKRGKIASCDSQNISSA